MKKRIHIRLAVSKATTIFAAAALVALVGLAHATDVSYTVSGWGPTQYPGPFPPPPGAPHLSYPGDTVQFQTYTGTLTLTPGTSVQKINTLLWTVNWTYNGTDCDLNNDGAPPGGDWPDLLFPINAARTMSFGAGPGETSSLSQTGLLKTTWADDYVTVNAGSTSTFFVPGYQINVTPLALGPTDVSNAAGDPPWIQPNQDVMATFEVIALPSGSLVLVPDKSCYQVGDTVTVQLWMYDVPQAIVGGQFFLQYNTSKLTFDTATATSPFTQLYLTFPGAGLIDYALQIPPSGNTTGNAEMAELTFTAAAEICTEPNLITWRAHEPPTRLSDNQGQPVVPLLVAMDVVDTVPPVITFCPPDVTIQCGVVPSPGNTGGPAIVTDNCDPAPVVTYSDGANLCGCGLYTGKIIRTWKATDHCGNVSTCTQTITVQDTTGPVITCPADTTIECTESTLPANTGQATAVDNCDSTPAVTYGDMYTAFNGLSSPPGWVFFSQNTAAGAFVTGPATPPAGVGSFHVVTGPGGPPPPTGGKSYLATSNHDGTLLSAITNFTYATYVAPTSPTSGLTTAINLYVDLDGNGTRDTTLVFEPVYVVGTQGPIVPGVWQTWDTLNGPGWWYTTNGGFPAQLPNPFNEFQPLSHYIALFPNAKIVSWGGAPGLNLVTGQNSSGPPWQNFDGYVDDVVFNTSVYDFEPAPTDCSATIRRTWTATDDCGNSSSCVQTITVQDTTIPSITCPANFSVQCVEDVPAPYANLAAFLAAGGTATDNCDTALALSLTSDTGLLGGGCGGTVTRVYRVTDDCGNFAECTQVITVDDTTPPVITLVPDYYWFQGFETDTAGWFDTTRVSSGTNGITSAAGSFHAEDTPAGAYTYWGGKDFTPGQIANGPGVPFHGYTTAVDIYLDVAGGWTNNTRFDFTSAINGSDGLHYSDFIFNGGFYNDAGPYGSGPRFVFSASYNSQPNSAYPKNPGRLPIAVSTSGWYTFEHHFYNNGGVLTVDMSIYDSANVLVNRWTLPSGPIGIIGGNRYGWFDFDEFSVLAFDNARLTTSDIAVNADAGGCTAQVTWPAATAADNCDGDLSASVLYDVDVNNDGTVDATQSGTTYIFPSGTHKVTAKATDACNNTGSDNFLVTVSGSNELKVNVQLSPIMATGPITRCITFELWDCNEPTPTEVTKEEVLTFTSGQTGVVTVLVPCGDYTCITARDKLHALRRTDEAFTKVGTQYVADFTGDPSSGGDWLIGGNLNDDYWIDILDFGVFSSRWNTAPGANTTCSTVGPHADISGDGVVNTNDFNWIRDNFLKSDEANCCGQPGFRDNETGPITRISVAELVARGLGELAAGDINGDGWLDEEDMALFGSNLPPAVHVGDLNCDGVVDFQDINPFVQELTSPASWQQAYPGCNPLNGDVNQDGVVNFADINPFVALLSQ